MAETTPTRGPSWDQILTRESVLEHLRTNPESTHAPSEIRDALLGARQIPRAAPKAAALKRVHDQLRVLVEEEVVEKVDRGQYRFVPQGALEEQIVTILAAAEEATLDDLTRRLQADVGDVDEALHRLGSRGDLLCTDDDEGTEHFMLAREALVRRDRCEVCRGPAEGPMMVAPDSGGLPSVFRHQSCTPEVANSSPPVSTPCAGCGAATTALGLMPAHVNWIDVRPIWTLDEERSLFFLAPPERPINKRRLAPEGLPVMHHWIEAADEHQRTLLGEMREVRGAVDGFGQSWTDSGADWNIELIGAEVYEDLPKPLYQLGDALLWDLRDPWVLSHFFAFHAWRTGQDPGSEAMARREAEVRRAVAAKVQRQIAQMRDLMAPRFGQEQPDWQELERFWTMGTFALYTEVPRLQVVRDGDQVWHPGCYRDANGGDE